MDLNAVTESVVPSPISMVDSTKVVCPLFEEILIRGDSPHAGWNCGIVTPFT